MKKKILGLGVVLILIGMLVLLTGCGDKTTNTNDSSTINTEQNNSNEQKEGISISEVVEPFANGYAIVKGTDGNKYVIDENGNVTYTINFDKYTFSNGYIIVDNDYIIDATGKKILEEDDTKSYLAISKSGYVVVMTQSSSLSGVSNKVDIEDLNGNSVYSYDKELSLEDCKYITGDLFRLNSTFINARTGKTFKDDNGDIPEIKGNAVDGKIYAKSVNHQYIISEDLEEVFTDQQDMWSKFDILGIINDKYFYAKTDDNNYGIYDMKGKLVKDLTDGGISYIFENDDVYYVKSNTGYIYTLDSNFEYITEPIKNTSTLLPTEKGIIGFIDSKVYLLDKTLEFNKELSYISDFSARDINNDIMKSTMNGFTYYLKDKFLYSDNNIIYNLETEKAVEIYK